MCQALRFEPIRQARLRCNARLKSSSVRGKLVRSARLLSVSMRLITMKLVLCLTLATAGMAGCKGVERFDTGPDSAYCLELIGGTFAESGLTPEDAGASDSAMPLLRLALTIDSQRLSTMPGMLWSNDAAFGLCSPMPLFDRVPIRTVEPALHDVVSSVQLKPDHVQDVFTWVDSSCQGTMVGILSLIDGGSVEVRLFKPAAAANENGPTRIRPGFGVFSRSQRLPSCEF